MSEDPEAPEPGGQNPHKIAPHAPSRTGRGESSPPRAPLVAAAVSVLLFLALGAAVGSGATQALDVQILRRIAAARTPLLDRLVVQITALGSTVVLLVLLLTLSAFLLALRTRGAVALMWVAVVVARALDASLKLLYGRPRPTVVPWEVSVASLSFPSGHALSSIVAYGVLAWLAARAMPSRAARAATWAAAALLILLVGTTRLYLGVHYPSDVLGGFLVGFAWLCIVTSLYRRLEARPSGHGGVPPPRAAFPGSGSRGREMR